MHDNQHPLMILATFLLLLGSVTLSASRPNKSFRWDHIEYVYVFGDSYSFVPGTFGLPSFSFIGDALNLAFTPEQLFTNQIIPNKTSSGGSNWLEFITGCFEGLPAMCPKQLWDFSHGGADITGSLLPPSRNTTVQVEDQVRQWLTYAADFLPRPTGKTLTTWWAGLNDCSHTCNNATITDVDGFLDEDMEVFFGLVSTAARNGLRTHLFLNVPPVDRSPFAETIRTGPQGLRDMIAIWNKKFVVRVAKYAKENPDQLIMTFDAASVFLDIFNNPRKFGFNDTANFCTTCTDQNEFFWHNDEHPTEHVHRILAMRVEEFLRNPKIL